MSGMTIPISFNPHGLQPVGNLMWQDGNGDGVALSVFELVPDLPAPLEDLPRLRRELAVRYAQSGATLIECDPVEVDSLPTLRQIVKLKNPQQQTGQVFLGTLLFPRATRSAVLKIQCIEWGTTGVRESMVMLRAGGPATFFTPSPFASDLDPREHGALPNHVADNREWDAQFPGHPLTRVRLALGWFAANVRVDPQFRALPPFA
jgi:hypothetical protein